MSNEETPGYPAPEMACIVVHMMVSKGPNLSSRAFRATTTPVVEQLALQTM
jgi:hypothetical protein